MKRGPQCDTLFEQMWSRMVFIPGSYTDMELAELKYNMRFAYCEGFKARAERDRGRSEGR